MTVATGAVRELAHARGARQGPEHLTPEERARRERMRVTANGFTAFELSKDGSDRRRHPLGQALRARPRERQDAPDRHRQGGGDRSAPVARRKAGRLRAGRRRARRARSTAAASRAPSPAAAPRTGRTASPTSPRRRSSSAFAASGGRPTRRSILFEEADASALEHFTIADPGHPENAADRVALSARRARQRDPALRHHKLALERARRRGSTGTDAQMPYVATVAGAKGRRPRWSCSTASRRTRSCSSPIRATGKTREAMHEHDDAWVNAAVDVTRRCRGGSPTGARSLVERARRGRAARRSSRRTTPSNVKWLTPPGCRSATLLDLDAAKRGGHRRDDARRPPLRGRPRLARRGRR